MGAKRTIFVERAETLAVVVAGLVREGITFEVDERNGGFLIQILGY